MPRTRLSLTFVQSVVLLYLVVGLTAGPKLFYTWYVQVPTNSEINDADTLNGDMFIVQSTRERVLRNASVDPHRMDVRLEEYILTNAVTNYNCDATRFDEAVFAKTGYPRHLNVDGAAGSS